MTKTTDRLTRIAQRQKKRANGDIVFGLLYLGAGLGNMLALLSL